MNIVVRDYQTTDSNFLYATFLRGLYHGSDYWSNTDQYDFYTYHQKWLDKNINKLKILIACLPDDEDVIIGYLIYKKNSIVFAYTKYEFRRMGIQNILGGGLEIDSCSNLTAVGNSIRVRKNLTFNPF